MNRKTKLNISTVLTITSIILAVLGVSWALFSFASGLYSDVLTIVSALRTNTVSDESITSAILRIVFRGFVLIGKLILGAIPAVIVQFINDMFFKK